LAALPLLAAADHGPPGYGYAPKLYCRETNTSVYAEVCVPGIDTATKPVELPVKNVADDRYCFTRTSTECDEQTKKIEREVCTYTYATKRESLKATTVKITDDVNSETMKVTTCSPAGYGYGHGHHKRSAGEHQYCREEYQTQEYRIPKVEEPTEVYVDAAVPEPRKECRTIATELTEVVCKDVSREVCISLAKYEDGVARPEQTEAILGEPDCAQITLTLPTEACRKEQGYHH